jgi:hypothetical protein
MDLLHFREFLRLGVRSPQAACIPAMYEMLRTRSCFARGRGCIGHCAATPRKSLIWKKCIFFADTIFSRAALVNASSWSAAAGFFWKPQRYYLLRFIIFDGALRWKGRQASMANVISFSNSYFSPLAVDLAAWTFLNMRNVLNDWLW